MDNECTGNEGVGSGFADAPHPAAHSTGSIEAGLRAWKSCFAAFPGIFPVALKAKPHFLTVAGAAQASSLPIHLFPVSPGREIRALGTSNEAVTIISVPSRKQRVFTQSVKQASKSCRTA
jgi:hypothetical protein